MIFKVSKNVVMNLIWYKIFVKRNIEMLHGKISENVSDN